MAEDEYPNAGRRVTMPPTGVIKSPPFHTTYPRLINDDMIEPGARAAMEVSWRKGYFEERDIEVFRVRGAHVAGEGLILDHYLQVIQNVSDDYTDQEVMQAVKEVRAAREARTIPHFGRLTHLTKRRAAHNYGHFLMEMLPMAYVGAKCVPYEKPMYLIHTAPPPSQDVMFRSLRLLGVDLNDVIVQGSHEPMYFDDLLVVRGLTKHGTYLSPLSVTAIGKMAERTVLEFSTMPGRGSDRLFVRRVPGWRRGRDLHNEKAISERLSACGFVTIEPGSMSLDHQIALFSRAKHVVGVTGAAMTNIAFCNPGTKVTMLVPGTFPDTFFWFIAQHRHLDYLEIRGDQTSYEPPESWNAGFTIREKDICYLENVRIAPD